MKPTENFPQELRDLKRWVTWKLVPAPDRPKPIKMPYGPNGSPAKVNDPATWRTFDEAAAAVEGGKYDGVGFVFTDTEYTGVDLDWNPDAPGPLGPVFSPDGNLAPWAANIVTALDSYTERSQSGNGVHIIIKGKLPAGARRKGPIETYDASSPRYFALTGDIGQRKTIRVDDGRLSNFHAAFLGGSGVEAAASVAKAEKVAAEDPRVAALVTKAKQRSPGLAALYTFGETRPGKSASESDSWMARELAKWERDPGVINAAMKASALARPKWSERRPNSPTGDLIGLAIKDALESVPERKHAEHSQESVTVADIIRDGLPEPPPFAVPGLAWRGRITLMAAREGLGKSTLFAEAAAAVTQGRDFLHGGVNSPKGVVLWVLVEEHADDFVIRAAHFAGAGHKGLDLLRYIERPEDALATLKIEVDRVKPTLVIVDTLHAFAGPLVEHASQADDWQVVMDAFRGIASSEAQPAVLMAAQASKSTGDYRDSTAIGHGVDVVLTLAKFDNEGEDGPTREIRIMKRRFPVNKTSYQMEGQGPDGQVGRLVKIGNIDLAAQAAARETASDRATMLRYMLALPPEETIAQGANPRSGRPPFGMRKANAKAACAGLVAERLAELVPNEGWRLTEAGRAAAAALAPPASRPRSVGSNHAASAMDANEEAAA